MAFVLFFLGGRADIVNAAEEQTDGYISIPCEDEVPALTTGEEETDTLLQKNGASLENYYVTDNLPEIRNQGAYGSCWAFASLALGEINMRKTEQLSMDLSELQLAYFTYHTVVDPLGGTEGDKNYLGASAGDFLQQGGNIMLALQTLANWKGAASEEVLPYNDESCQNALEDGIEESYAYEDVAHIKNAYIVNLKENAQEAKELIKEYGGLATSYYNATGCYNGTYNSYYNPNKRSVNHAITIVGWDDDFPKENFTDTPQKDGAWLVRNSWGVEGENYYGYFWMSYEENTLSKAAYAFEFVSSQSEEYYDNNYQYDGSIYYLKSVPVSDGNTITTANVFEAQKEEEELKAVSFETYATDESYEISIYRDLTDLTNPESGTLVETKSGETTFAGLYQVAVDGMTLAEGQNFAVVVTLTRAAGNPSMMMEYDYNSWLVCETSAEAGQSFVKENGVWEDFGAANNRNIRIKAYTNTTVETPPQENATEITLSEQELTLAYGKSASLTATLNGTGEINWSSDDTSVATVEDGKIKAVGYGIAVITAQTGEVTAQCYVYVYPPEVEAEVTAEEAACNRISWNKIEGITGYRIYRCNLETEEEELLAEITDITATAYDDTTFLQSENYGYYVVTYVASTKGEVESDVLNWCYVHYLLAYHLAGGTNAESNPSAYYANDEEITLASPARKGYTFAGWYTDSAYTNRVKKIDTAKHDIFTLYAKWVKDAEQIKGEVTQEGGKGGVEEDEDAVQSVNTAQTAEQIQTVETGDDGEQLGIVGMMFMFGSACIMLVFRRKRRE